jgi:hypothetical protein
MTTIWSKRAKNTSTFVQRIKNASNFTNKVKNVSTFLGKVKNFLVYFWGDHEDRYVIDHLGRKIVFSEDLSFAGRSKNTTSYTNRAKN